jgi:hypothetical protein
MIHHRLRDLARDLAVAVCCVVLAAGCGRSEPDSAVSETELVRVETADADLSKLPPAELAKARQTATALAQGLSQLVFSTMEKEGPAATVRVCSEVAQERTAAHAADGVYVRRISDRLRSPLNAADEVEARELERMHELDAEGRLPPEIIRLVQQGDIRSLQLLRPIRIQQPCLACHGEADAIDPEVRRILAERYPDDQATGYSVGDLRGAVSVRVRVNSGPE